MSELLDTDTATEVNLDDFQAYMPTHSYIFTPSGERWSAASVNARIPPIWDDGKPISASVWLDRHRWVAQATWAPGMPMLIENRLVDAGGWIEKPACAVLNLYRPSTLVPVPGDASPWVNHLYRIYPDNADHLIYWFAYRAQRPDVKINHAILLGGVPGIGKDSLIEPIKRAIGSHNFTEVSPAQILGRFNGYFKSVILRINELHDLGDSDRFSFYARMKTPTAAPPDVLRIDEKNIREHSIFNLCGIIYTSNDRLDSLYLPADDRRHYVTWSDAKPSSEDKTSDLTPAYFDKLHNWIDSGGDAIVAHYLHTFDLSGFNPKRPPAKTPAFWAIVNANRKPETAELADALDKLGNPPVVTLTAIKDLGGELAVWLNDRRNIRAIQHRLGECKYSAVSNDDAEDKLWLISRKRQVVYVTDKLSGPDRLNAARAFSRGETWSPKVPPELDPDSWG